MAKLKTKKNHIIVLALIAVLLIGGSVAFASLRKEPERVVVESNTFKDGTIACIPQKMGRVNTHCVLGLKEDATGTFYELLDRHRVGPEGTLQYGKRYRLKGNVVRSYNKDIVADVAIVVDRAEPRN